MERGIPFAIKMPNLATIEAMKEAREGKHIEKVTLEQLKEEMRKCIVP